MKRKNKYRRFYHAIRFWDDTAYLEWRGVKNGGMFMVTESGKKRNLPDWKLYKALQFVKDGLWIEK